MKDDYQKRLNEIHAPRELVERTKIEMRNELAKEQKKIKVTIILKRSALAGAVIMLIAVGSFSYYSWQNQINMASVSDTAFSLDHNFGNANAGQAKPADDKIVVSQASEAKIVPEFLKEVKPSKIKGVSVQLGVDDKGRYHAAYTIADQYYYVVGEDVSQADFIAYLKKKL